MNFPYTAFQTIIAYLTWLGAGGTGSPPHGIPELVKAATEIINWAVELIYGNVGLVTVQRAMPVNRADQARALEDLCNLSHGGSSVQMLPVPSWLLEMLAGLLMEWIKGRLKP